MKADDDVSIETLDSVVSRLNQEIYELVGEDEDFIPCFEVVSSGCSTAVMLLGQTLWCSEDDDRRWDEAEQHQEPVEVYLRRKTMELLDLLDLLRPLKTAPKRDINGDIVEE